MNFLILLCIIGQSYSRLFDYNVCKQNIYTETEFTNKEINFFCDRNTQSIHESVSIMSIKNIISMSKDIKLHTTEEVDFVLSNTLNFVDIDLQFLFYISKIMEQIAYNKHTKIYTELLKNFDWKNKRGDIELYKTLRKVSKVLTSLLEKDLKSTKNLMETIETIYTDIIFFDDKIIITTMLRTYYNANYILKNKEYTTKINNFLLYISDIVSENKMNTQTFFKEELYREYVKKIDKKYVPLFVKRFIFPKNDFLCENRFVSGFIKMKSCFQEENKDPSFYNILDNTYSALLDKLGNLFNYPDLSYYTIEIYSMKDHKEYIRNGEIMNYPTSNGGVTISSYDIRTEKRSIKVYVYWSGKEYNALSHEFIHVLNYLVLPKYFSNKVISEGLAEYFGNNYNRFVNVKGLFSFPNITAEVVINGNISPYQFGFLFFNYVFDKEGVDVFAKMSSKKFYEDFLINHIDDIIEYSEVVYDKIKKNTLPISNTLNLPDSLLMIDNENYIFYHGKVYYNNEKGSIVTNLIDSCIIRNVVKCPEISPLYVGGIYTKIIKKVTVGLYKNIREFKIYNFNGNMKTEKEVDFFFDILFDYGIKHNYNEKKKVYTDIREGIRDSVRIQNSIPLWSLSTDVQKIIYIINLGKDLYKELTISIKNNEPLDTKDRTLSDIISIKNNKKYNFLLSKIDKPNVTNPVNSDLEKIVNGMVKKYILNILEKTINVIKNE